MPGRLANVFLRCKIQQPHAGSMRCADPSQHVLHFCVYLSEGLCSCTVILQTA
jgi:hypothetical protein